jgi:methyl-accepting chemotaxis protein
VVDPVFWLGVSILFVAVSIAAVLVAALPAFQELARAARSAEKLFDTLNREMPPTLKSIRDTGAEISSLTGDMSEGVQGAGRVVSQVDQGIGGVTKKAQVTTRGLMAGVKTAWKTFQRSALEEQVEGESALEQPAEQPRLPASTRLAVEIEGIDSDTDRSDTATEELSHYSDSVAKLTEELDNLRDRLAHEKSGNPINK